jgi:Zn-dependent protease with chaperone function
MAMDFFESQDVARKKTGRLVILFIMAVIAIVLAVFVLFAGAAAYVEQEALAEQGLPWYSVMTLDLFLGVTVITLVIVGGGSLYKVIQLRGGGTVIAESLGGRLLYQDTTDPLERKVLNVVEEMAIASGTPAPPVYLMDDEGSINAFAAGFSLDDAVIGVTRGCAQQLGRDELQGVIAHEFSHILNGDMRLNIKLIGILHGILVIGIIGYFILRSALYSGGRGGGGGKKGNPLPFLALGGGLMVIGYVGTFFGKVIKAAVSRQREYLADAAAVQYTRNPEGIGGALKKIGGFVEGTHIESPNAPEASHMFFGEAVISRFGGLLATHPPLPDRIKRIDPSWQGGFEEADSFAVEGAEAAQPLAAGAAGFAGDGQAAAAVPGAPPPPPSVISIPSPAPGGAPPAAPAFPATARLSGRPRAPGAPVPPPPAVAYPVLTDDDMKSAIDHVGQPTSAHISYAQDLISHLPREVVEAAHESYGARALIYSLLMDESPEIRASQLERLSEHADPGAYAGTNKILPAVDRLEARVRLPLIDMAIPALRTLSYSQYRAFKDNVFALVAADQKLDLFEWSLQRILMHRVEPQFTPVEPPKVRYKGLDQVRDAVQQLLSTLAHVGNVDHGQAFVAFDRAKTALYLPQLALLDKEQCSLTELDTAVDTLAQIAPRLKKQLLQAAAVCISADNEITIGEAELFRAIADTLDCPMPPFLPGQKVE